MELIVYQTSSLNKTLIDDARRPVPLTKLSCLKGEEISWQIVCKLTGTGSDARFCQPFTYSIQSDLAEHVTVREIVNVPSEVPAHVGISWGSDEDFITTKPGLFPDLLQELHDGELELPFNYYRSYWISAKIPADAKPGAYPVQFWLGNEELKLSASKTMHLEVLDAQLPPQKLIHSEWLHSDCLMSYYRVPALSEEHWRICGEWIKTAVDNGVNMILTPIFSLTMDLKVGIDRPVLQLVKVKKEGNTYSFDFEDLRRWIRMCLELGVQYIELSHLFTQWGAKYAPTVMVEENGQTEKLFGWHTAGMAPEYQNFLRQLLPELTAFLKAAGVAERTVFHVSDEPCLPDREHYSAALNLVRPYLQGFRIIDAVFDVDMYAADIIQDPIVVTARYHLCAQTGRKPDFVYYLHGQSYHWSNRLFAMESRRNRVFGLQLYANDIKGFLHWGFNFYYNYDSRYLVDPFLTTEGRNTYVSGCPFIVYPGWDGKPMESIRLKVLHEALQDLRALQLLEKWMSRQEILAMIEEQTGGPVAFDWCAPDDAFLLNFREKINGLIRGFTAG